MIVNFFEIIKKWKQLIRNNSWKQSNIFLQNHSFSRFTARPLHTSLNTLYLIIILNLHQKIETVPKQKSGKFWNKKLLVIFTSLKIKIFLKTRNIVSRNRHLFKYLLRILIRYFGSQLSRRWWISLFEDLCQKIFRRINLGTIIWDQNHYEVSVFSLCCSELIDLAFNL